MSADRLDRLRPVRATIDLGRLAANYRAVAAATPVPIMPVVKADAYGHGARHVARRLAREGATMFAVAYVEEALALRGAGIVQPIVVLSPFGRGQMDAIRQHGLTPVVGTAATLDLVTAPPPPAFPRLGVHLKIDTGMTRLGFAPEEATEAAARLVDSGRVEIAGVLTHLASADEDADATRRQLDIFDAALAKLAARGIRPPLVHVANSAGLAFHRPHYTLARPGLLLYGLLPRPLSPAIEVRPVMSVSADVAAIRAVEPGTAVSYGGRWTAKRPSRIATLPIGYADGVARTRAMSEQGYVTIGGARAPIAGTVCMDLTLVDVTDVPAVAVGDAACVMGDDPSAWQVAEWSGANAWESLTRVGARMTRVYVESGALVAVESRFL